MRHPTFDIADVGEHWLSLFGDYHYHRGDGECTYVWWSPVLPAPPPPPGEEK